MVGFVSERRRREMVRVRVCFMRRFFVVWLDGWVGKRLWDGFVRCGMICSNINLMWIILCCFLCNGLLCSL